jgi:hypothetical protein
MTAIRDQITETSFPRLIPFDTKSGEWYHFYGKYGPKIEKPRANKKAPTLCE